MRAFLLAMGYDTAGQLAAIRHALATERPDWTVDQMRRKSKWLAYPTQHEWDEGLARRLWRKADVVHVNLSLMALRLFGRKPLVIHHHGTEYRDNRAAIDGACAAAGVVQVASTLDLTGPAEWLPAVVDADALARMRRRFNARTVRIAHSPTDRTLKQTDAVIAAVDALREQGLPVELDLIEGVPWAECLARKAKADILVDQLELGYGLSAVEAWAMGIPVVAGATDPALRERMCETFGVPFVEATPETLGERLAELVGDARLRREWGDRGREHVAAFHSERAVADRVETIYARAVAR